MEVIMKVFMTVKTLLNLITFNSNRGKRYVTNFGGSSGNKSRRNRATI